MYKLARRTRLNKVFSAIRMSATTAVFGGMTMNRLLPYFSRVLIFIEKEFLSEEKL